MEGKINVVVGMMVVVSLLGGQYLIRDVKANVAALVVQESCLANCIRGCRDTGISPLRCFKYCEKHCLASPSSSSFQKSPALHYCNLGCMLEKCAKFNNDEGKEESCVAKCETNVCLLG